HFVVPTSRDPAATPLDPIGTVLSVIGLTSVLFAIIEAPTRGAGSPVVLGAVFVGWQLRSDHPMLDVRFFENPRFTAASLAVTLIFFAMTGLLFFLTQYLQSVLGYSTLRAGLALIPLGLAMSIAAPNSARLDARFGSKTTVVGGTAIATVGVGLLAFAQPEGGYGLVAVVLALLGIGLGTAMTPATNAIMGSLPLGNAGVG